MIRLPDSFLREMQELLGSAYQAFLDSYEQPCCQGLRINRLKLEPPLWERITPFPLKPVPWIDNGYTYQDTVSPAKAPYYYGGLYYLQEPSAMTPANRLPVSPGDRVLDLCAAPGGKTTELGGKLQGSGFLVSNDISPSRAKALLKNVKLAGLDNTVITVETPERLAAVFPGFFEKILVDAPCSGEGMFRRDPGVIKNWDKQDKSIYPPMQREILKYAAVMLKPGGMLLYSTCTFSQKENEENVLWLLKQFPELSLVPPAPYRDFGCGLLPGTEQCVRIWPHKMAGEGHFLALFAKEADAASFSPASQAGTPGDKKLLKALSKTDFFGFMEDCAYPLDTDRLFAVHEYLYLLPDGYPNPAGLRTLRNGLLLGTIKNNRFTPSQDLALTLKNTQYARCLNLSREDIRTVKYLKGETIPTDPDTEKGWQLVCTDGFPLGWGKAADGS